MSSDQPPATSNLWYVYIIQTKRGRFYTGITTDVLRRFNEHQGGTKKRGAKYFNSDSAEFLVFAEQASDRSAATRREIAIKRLSAREKRLLINFQAPISLDLKA